MVTQKSITPNKRNKFLQTIEIKYIFSMISDSQNHDVKWRGVRVAEGARLESVCSFTVTVGSNPTLSAKDP